MITKAAPLVIAVIALLVVVAAVKSAAPAIVMICEDRPPVVLYGEWWPGDCTYVSGPRVGASGVEAQIAGCYCSWWLARHPKARWTDCKYPPPTPKWVYGSKWLCSQAGRGNQMITVICAALALAWLSGLFIGIAAGLRLSRRASASPVTMKKG